MPPWMSPWTSPWLFFAFEGHTAVGDADAMAAARPDTPHREIMKEEYWVWREGHLVPATRNERECIHLRERKRQVRGRLKQWQRRQRMQRLAARWRSLRAQWAGAIRHLEVVDRRAWPLSGMSAAMLGG